MRAFTPRSVSTTQVRWAIAGPAPSKRCRCTQASKRDALAALLSWPAAAAALLDVVAQPSAAAASQQAAAAASQQAAAAGRDPMFYATWPYSSPADILRYLDATAVPGDSQSVLNAMDAFSIYYPQFKIGPEKGALLEQQLQQPPPRLALELGTFLGYSAIRTARHLAPGGHLFCVEANADNAAVATRAIALAGLADRVTVVTGLSGQVIPSLPALLLQQQQPGRSNLQPQQQSTSQQSTSQQQQQQFDVVFLDHAKACYLPDLQALEQLGLLARHALVLADNVVYPGAPGYLEYLDSSGRFTTRLLEATYEYEQPWNPDWEPNKRDALSVSVFAGGEE